MNTKEIIDFLKEEYEKKFNVPNATDEDLIEWLRELRWDAVYEERYVSYRWWDSCLYVIKIGNKFIRYQWAHATGDMTAYELGWRFDFETLCECEEKQKTITYYEPKVI